VVAFNKLPTLKEFTFILTKVHIPPKADEDILRCSEFFQIGSIKNRSLLDDTSTFPSASSGQRLSAATQETIRFFNIICFFLL